jgi:short-subunit dehydrogenase
MSSLPKFHFPGARAVVTGAASGMGEQITYQLAERGAQLALVDRDADRLAGVAEHLAARHPAISLTTHVVDLSDSGQISELNEALRRHHVDLLVNNAGVALGGRFADISEEEFDWVLQINFRAPVALTRGLLPVMPEGAHIVNVSSLFGLVAPPGQTAYSASKFALRGFSEALRRELRPAGIGVTTVHPGGIRTRIAETARVAAAASDEEVTAGKAAFAKMLTYPADRAAAEIINGVAGRRGRVVIAPEAVALDVVARIAPVDHFEIATSIRNQLRRVGRYLPR